MEWGEAAQHMWSRFSHSKKRNKSIGRLSREGKLGECYLAWAIVQLWSEQGLGSGWEPSCKMCWTGNFGLLMSVGLLPISCKAKALQLWAGKLFCTLFQKKWDHPWRLREFKWCGRPAVSRMEVALKNVHVQRVVYPGQSSVAMGRDLETLALVSHPPVSPELAFCLVLGISFL